MRIRIYDIENLPFRANIIVVNSDGKEEQAIVVNHHACFEDGRMIPLNESCNCEIYLG